MAASTTATSGTAPDPRHRPGRPARPPPAACASCARPCPGPSSTSRPPSEPVRPIVDDVRERGAAALYDARRAVRRGPAAAPAGARRRRRRRARHPRPRRAGRARGVDPAGPARARRPAPHRHHDQVVTDGGTVTERWVPVDRVGLYVPGGLAVYPSSVVMNVVPAQLARVRVAGRRQPAAGRPRRLAAPHHPRRVRAARRRRGVGVGGAQAVAAFAYGVDDGADVCEPVSLVTGPGNIYVAAAKRLLKGVIGIDAEAGPTEIAVLADDTADPEHVAADLVSPGRARPAGRGGAGHRLARRWPTPSRPPWCAGSPRPSTPSGWRTALAGHPVGDRARRRRRRRARPGQRLRRRAPRDPDPRRRGRGRPGAQRRRGLRRRLVAGQPRRLLRRVQPRAAHRRVRLPQQRAVGAVVPARHPRRQLLGATRCARSAATWSRWPAPRTSRPTVRPCSRATPRPTRRRDAARLDCPTMDPRSTVEALLRPDLRGRTAYGAPQLDVAVALNTNENSYPVPPDVVAAITEAVAAVAAGLNRYPDREFTALREALAAYLSRSGTRLRRRAGLGRQRLQRGAPAPAAGVRRAGAHRARLHAGVLDAPDHHARRPARPGSTGCAGCDGAGAFDLDAGIRRRAGAAAPARRRLPLLAEQPDRHGPRPRRRRGGARRGAGGAGRRRRGLRRVRPAGHAQRADPARRAGRGWSSPAR